MILSALPFYVLAQEKTYPLIVLQGYSGPTLVNEDTGEKVWGLDFDKVGERVMERLPDIASGLVNTDLLVSTLGEVLLETLEPIACNPDGTSKYNVTNTPKGAEATRVSTLKENGGDYIPEPEFVDAMGEKIGYENIFAFSFDWRKGQIEYAKAIDEYIQEVKELTGSDKVDIFGLSHGGQCGASYIYYYGYKKDVRKAVFDAPAIGGTSIVGEFFTGGEMNIDFSTIIEFAEQGFGVEKEWKWLLEYIGFENLNAVLNRVLQEYAYDFAKYFPSLWDFVPVDYFDEAMNRANFNSIENAPLVTATTLHHEAMANMHSGLQKARDMGIDISILSSTGTESLTGNSHNSDYIIDAYTSSGANCALLGEQFPENYTQAGTQCGNKNHCHISPDRNIDASTAYLPDNTWFVKGQFHGTYIFDEYTKNLVLELLTTDNIKNVFSDPKYPQFEIAQNHTDGVYARFSNTSSGYRTLGDTSLILKNLSVESEALIWSIKADGADIVFEYERGQSIPRGKVAKISIADGDYDAYTKPFTVTVRYSLRNSQMTYISKTFTFMPLSSQEAKTFAYLTTPAEIVPDLYEEDMTEAEQPSETPSQPEPTVTEANTENTTNSQNVKPEKIPNTNNSHMTAVVAAAVLFCGAVCMAAVIVKRRKFNQ